MPQGLGLEAVEAMLAQRLQCSAGDRSRVSSTSSESLSDGQMTCGGCCFYCQGKLAKPRRRKLGAFPTNYGTPRKALLSFLCHAIEAAFYPLLLLHIY